MSALLDRPSSVAPSANRRAARQEPKSLGTSFALHRAISLVAMVGLFGPLFNAWNDIVAVPASGIAVVALSAGGLWLAGAISTAQSQLDLERLDRWLLVLALLALGAFAAAWLHGTSGYGTDEAAFQQGAAMLLVHGHNPYGANLLSALAAYSTPSRFATHMMNGGLVTTYGYPAFPLYIVAAFVELTGGGQAVPIADVAMLMVATVVMFKLLPVGWRGLAVIIGVGFPILTGFALAGVNAIIAMAALLVVAFGWTATGETGRLSRADLIRAVALGVALATNQIAWFVTPFLLIGTYLLRHSQFGPRRALKLAASYLGTALATFVVINLPFIVWDPSAWVTGVAAPLTQHAIPYGQGLIGLTLFLRMGGGALDAYNYGAALLYVALLIVYASGFRRLARACFLLPIGALFVSGRSLGEYWLTLIAVMAIGAMTCQSQAISAATELRLPARWRHRLLPRGVLTMAVFVPGLACLGLALTTPQPLTLRILSAHSSRLLRGVDRMRVEVENQSGQALTPHFATNASGQAIFWNVAQGPSRLAPHTAAVYVLTAPDDSSMQPNGTAFILEAVTPAPRTISSSRPFAKYGPVPGGW